jgi:hypothetical protein
MGMFTSRNVGETGEPDEGVTYPADFTADEAAFASDLRRLFSPEREELPPRYVETLLGEPCQRPIESGFEQKLAYRVFRQLDLPRPPLFDPPVAKRRANPVDGLARRLGQVSATAVISGFLLMVMSAFLAGPSFAAGLRILLGQTGVQQVSTYPTTVRTPDKIKPPVAAASLAPDALVQWFGRSVHNYAYAGMSLLAPQVYSAGPVVELNYVLQNDVHAGTGILTVREFQLAPDLSSVLQVVGDGSVTPVKINNAQGVFVDGHWHQVGMKHVWQPGGKGELIMEQGDQILWIVADQRDGIDATQMVAIAKHLTPTPLESLQPRHRQLRSVAQAMEASLDVSFSDELLALVPLGSSQDGGGTNFVSIAQDPGYGMGS